MTFEQYQRLADQQNPPPLGCGFVLLVLAALALIGFLSSCSVENSPKFKALKAENERLAALPPPGSPGRQDIVHHYDRPKEPSWLEHADKTITPLTTPVSWVWNKLYPAPVPGAGN